MPHMPRLVSPRLASPRLASVSPGLAPSRRARCTLRAAPPLDLTTSPAWPVRGARLAGPANNNARRPTASPPRAARAARAVPGKARRKARRMVQGIRQRTGEIRASGRRHARVPVLLSAAASAACLLSPSPQTPRHESRVHGSSVQSASYHRTAVPPPRSRSPHNLPRLPPVRGSGMSVCIMAPSSMIIELQQ